MNNRERTLRILHFESADRLPAVHFGYWRELLSEWAEQGHIPRELATGWGDANDCDRAAVDREIERMERLAGLGGFIPCPDHRLMPGSKFELVQYYVDKIKSIKI